jgi:Barstar (barnase inhibitor)
VSDSVATAVPELAGHGVVWAAEWQSPSITAALTTRGWALAHCWSAVGAGMRQTQAAVATALRLPEPAGRNLDALADLALDLPRFWPGEDKVALLWHDADVLETTDRAGHDRLVQILRGAAAEQAADLPAGPHREAEPPMTFEAVLFGREGADL